MAYNSVEEIKDILLLESENQTLTDSQIQAYINDANLEMFNFINRTAERDEFISEKQGSVTFYPFFNVFKICSIKVNSEFIEASDYSISIDGDGVTIANISIGDIVELITIPTNYKMLERAICMVNIRTRLNPFKNDTIDPIYNEYTMKRDKAIKLIKSKFGAALYNG